MPTTSSHSKKRKRAASTETEISSSSSSSSVIVVGQNKSGRSWKKRPLERASAKHTSKPKQLRSWARRQAEREAKRAVKEKEAEMKEETRAKAVAEKERRLEKMARKQQNEFNSATYQVINKGHKLKTMNKKQLRMIKKLQVNSKTGQKEFVSPWKAKK